MNKPAPLTQIQQWMQAVIMHPAGVVAGVDSDQAKGCLPVDPEAIETVITRSKALDSVGRLEVYAHAYHARLLECLREEFPATTMAIGAEAFDELAFGYLQACPPTSYTLNHLATRFPQYLADTRPEREAGSTAPDWADLLVDLAMLEVQFAEVFDGPGIEKSPLLTAESLQSIAPEDWPAARLIPAPCLRVVEHCFPLDPYYTALRRAESPAVPDPAPSWMAITRRDYVVRRHVLSQPQAILLQALLQGQTIGEAIEAAAGHVQNLDEFAGQLRGWFENWSRAAFFIRVDAELSTKPCATA
jgi:hypothetical protein